MGNVTGKMWEMLHVRGITGDMLQMLQVRFLEMLHVKFGQCYR